MARLKNLQIENTADGRKLLRFGSIVVNVGAGRFETRVSRTDTTTNMTVRQRIHNGVDGYRNRRTTAQMYFAGDGHTHWRLRDLEDFKLQRLDNGAKVGPGAKHGFCFLDNWPFRATGDVFYRGCANSRPEALSVKTGLSRGWDETYPSRLPDRHIDVTTGLTRKSTGCGPRRTLPTGS